MTTVSTCAIQQIAALQVPNKPLASPQFTGCHGSGRPLGPRRREPFTGDERRAEDGERRRVSKDTIGQKAIAVKSAGVVGPGRMFSSVLSPRRMRTSRASSGRDQGSPFFDDRSRNRTTGAAHVWFSRHTSFAIVNSIVPAEITRSPAGEEGSHGSGCLFAVPLRQRQEIQVVLPADSRPD